MLKKLAILVSGVLAGMAVMYLMRPDEVPSAPTPEVPNQQDVAMPELDLTPLYDQLMEERRGGSDEKYWFDQRIEDLSNEGQQRIKRQQSEGDEAAELFDQFSKPVK